MQTEILRIIAAIITIESSNLPNPKPGDHGKAIGPMQIHKTFVDDCNRIVGEKLWTYKDRSNRKASINMAVTYLVYYGGYYQRTTGKVPTPTIYAALWNGGPDGYTKINALNYAAKVTNELAR